MVNRDDETVATARLTETVVGSYDPNDKLVSDEVLEETQVQGGHTLTYTVRFQNTGSAEAIHVRIEDELDETRLDLSTLSMVAASHTVTGLSLDGNGHLDFIGLRYFAKAKQGFLWLSDGVGGFTHVQAQIRSGGKIVPISNRRMLRAPRAKLLSTRRSSPGTSDRRRRLSVAASGSSSSTSPADAGANAAV